MVTLQDLNVCECYHELLGILLSPRLPKLNNCTYGNNCYLLNVNNQTVATNVLYELKSDEDIKGAIGFLKTFKSKL